MTEVVIYVLGAVVASCGLGILIGKAIAEGERPKPKIAAPRTTLPRKLVIAQKRDAWK